MNVIFNFAEEDKKEKTKLVQGHDAGGKLHKEQRKNEAKHCKGNSKRKNKSCKVQ